ncbi:hypothetical protein [Helicobacter sp. 11S02596-1]|uniref:hypothetical protein n=1 Tax=Helicobacter sp. 11S02596-1 TaxID=1476194 RepID=UPI00117B704A|nr:hypothetical protein [Helicobacter sp. 11S02596-1]
MGLEKILEDTQPNFYTKIINFFKKLIEKTFSVKITKIKKTSTNPDFLSARNTLIKMLQEKQKLLKNISEKDFDTLSEDFDSINEKIYKQYRWLKSINEDTAIRFKLECIFDSFLNSRMGIGLSRIKLFIHNLIKYPFLSFLMFFTIGIIIFTSYFFFKLEYIPNMTRESLLFYLMVLSTTGILAGIIFGILQVLIPLIIEETFRYKSLSKKQVLLLSISMISPAIVMSILDHWNMKSIYWFVCIIVVIMAIFSLYRYILKNIFQSSLFTLFILLMSIVFFLFIIIFPNYTLEILLIIFYIVALAFILRGYAYITFIVILFLTTIIISAIFSSKFISLLHFGNYSPKILVLDTQAKALIPQELNNSEKIAISPDAIKIQYPKILSNIGEEYYVAIPDKQNQPHRFTIPRRFILSEDLTEKCEQDKPQETPQAKPKEHANTQDPSGIR